MSQNATLLSSSKLPPTLGDFATINNPLHGKPLTKHRKYLDKVHIDIIHGDGLGLGGFKYGLLLVDVATRYCWVYGLQTLSSNEIVSQFEQFVVNADNLPKTFNADFDKKLIGGDAQHWIINKQI